jgi:DNA polymerase-3 subunit delta'
VAKRPSKRVVERVYDRPEAAPAPRPVPLGEILGQDRALAVLRDAVRSGRMHHAWIFHGPGGVGKFTTALAFAALILDPTSQPGLTGEVEPEPDSPTQRLLAAGTHPDLQIISKELARVSREAGIRDSKQTSIAAEVIREFLIEHSSKSRQVGSASLASRVYIVDEAELIGHTGHGALLKTLEEPSPGRVIILVTSQEERLPITIRSRCQRIAFGPLDEASMDAWFKRAGLGSGDKKQQAWLKWFADGSPGVAALAASTGLYAWYQALEPMLEQADSGAFPLDLAPAAASMVDEWAKAWTDAGENRSKDAANRAGARHLFRMLAERYRRDLRGAAPARDKALRAIDAIRDAETLMDTNVQLPLALEDLAARLSRA